jgi:hypothetical protein
MYSGPIIILPGNKYDLTVVFWNNGSPYTTEQATITINSNDISESAYTFVVEGTEIAPLLRVKGNNLVIGNGDTTPRPQDHTHFGEVDVLGSGMVTRYFTLENIGIGPLNISAVSLTPSSTSSFILWSLSSSTIAAGSSTTLRVDFDPEMTSADTAVISVLSDSYSGSPHTFTIAGTGRRPQLTVKGNGFTIAQGDYTPTSTDHHQFRSQEHWHERPLAAHGRHLHSGRIYRHTHRQPGSAIAAGSRRIHDLGCHLQSEFCRRAHSRSSCILERGSRLLQQSLP